MTEPNPDTLVIGGGPSGLMAALTAARAGERVTLVDEWPELGGRLRYRRQPVPIAEATCSPAKLWAWLVDVAHQAGIDLRPATVAWGAFAGRDGRQIGLVLRSGAREMLKPKRLILATGTTDRAGIFPGATLPGVFTARAVQILLNVHHVRPGRRFAVVGDDAPDLPADIRAAGGEVVVEIGVDAVDRLVVTGAGGVEWIELDGARWEVDVVAIATGRQLDAQLAWMLGCEAAPSFRSPFGTPDRDGEGQTSVAGVLVAGSVAGASTIEEALLDGLAVAGGRSADLAAVLPLSRLGAED